MMVCAEYMWDMSGGDDMLNIKYRNKLVYLDSTRAFGRSFRSASRVFVYIISHIWRHLFETEMGLFV